MTNSNPNSRPFSPLQKFSRAALLALPLLLLASCGGGGGDRASNGGDSFSPLPGSPEPDPPTVGQPGPGTAINSALSFGDWAMLTRRENLFAIITGPSLETKVFSFSNMRHLTSQETRSLTGEAEYTGRADVKRGSEIYPLQTMHLIVDFDHNTYAGSITPSGGPLPWGISLTGNPFPEGDSAVLIHGYGSPPEVWEPGSSRLTFHPETGSSVVTAEAVSVFIRSDSDPSFGAFGYADKKEAY